MNDIILLCLAFACGGFLGFITATFLAVGSRADEPDEFDGGFTASNPPPVRTVIWSSSVKNSEDR